MPAVFTGDTEDQDLPVVNLAAARLPHDAVVDSHYMDHGQIEAHFGAAVARVVEACTDTAAHDTIGKKSPWIERKQRYLVQVAEADDGVHLVVACDKLDNLQSLVADLAREGPGTLDRFSGSPRQTRWYYESVRELISNRIPAPLRDALDDSLATLREFVEEASPER